MAASTLHPGRDRGDLDIAGSLVAATRLVVRDFAQTGLPIGLALLASLSPVFIAGSLVLMSHLAAMLTDLDATSDPTQLLEALIDLVFGVGIGLLATLLLSGLIFGGIWRIAMAAARGQPAGFGLLRTGITDLWPMAVGLTWWQLATLVGLMACYLPGLALMTLLAFFPIPIIDRGLSGTDAVALSWRLTEGHRLEILLWGLLANLALSILQVVTLGIGSAFFGLPVLMTTMTLVYDNLARRYPERLPQ
jgi:uncharacterized membrane protein